eukprot:m51a1_g1318 hypothetical protein (2292) ;mRNA; f:229093-238496
MERSSSVPCFVRQTALLEYVSLALMSGALVVIVVPFAVHFMSRRKEILADMYPTISAFSADPSANPVAARFITVMTCLIGAVLCTLLIEERNSRCDDHTDPRFWVELTACAVLPLAGIFHTEGASGEAFQYYGAVSLRGCTRECDAGGCCPEGVRRHCYCCDVFRIPIWVSSWIHSLAAMFFMLANTAMNVSYAMSLYDKDGRLHRAHSAPNVAAMALSWTTVGLLATFVCVIAAYTLVKKYSVPGTAGVEPPKHLLQEEPEYIAYMPEELKWIERDSDIVPGSSMLHHISGLALTDPLLESQLEDAGIPRIVASPAPTGSAIAAATSPVAHQHQGQARMCHRCYVEAMPREICVVCSADLNTPIARNLPATPAGVLAMASFLLEALSLVMVASQFKLSAISDLAASAASDRGSSAPSSPHSLSPHCLGRGSDADSENTPVQTPPSSSFNFTFFDGDSSAAASLEARLCAAASSQDAFCVVPVEGTAEARTFARDCAAAAPSRDGAAAALAGELEPSSRLCLDCIRGDYSVVRLQHRVTAAAQAATTSAAPQVPVSAAVMSPSGLDELSSPDSDGSMSPISAARTPGVAWEAGEIHRGVDDIDPALLEGSPDSDAANAAARAAQHNSKFPRLLLPQSAEIGVSKEAMAVMTPMPDVPAAFESRGQVVIKAQQLSFSLGQIEPFFATVSLYDTETEEKIGEDFHFDLNKGDSTEWTGAPALSDLAKSVRNLTARFHDDCKKYGKYRQYFCCAAFEVSDDEGHVVFGVQNGAFQKVDFKDKKELFEYLSDQKDMKRKGKTKPENSKRNIPSTWRISLQKPEDLAANSTHLDTMRRTFKPSKHTFDQVQHLCHFTGSVQLSMCRSLVNTIFIYPDSLVLPKYKKKLNVCVSVYLRDRDTSLDSEESYLMLLHMNTPTDTEKTVFSLRLHIVSTVYPQDPNLSKFVSLVTSPSPSVAKIEESMNVLTTLCSSKPELTVQYLSPILRGICIACNALECNNFHPIQLQQYLTYDFANINSETMKFEVFEGLTASLGVYFRFLSQSWQEGESGASYESVLGLFWFILQLITKSLALELYKRKHLADPRRNQWLILEERWTAFSKNLSVVARNLGKFTRQTIEKSCNYSPCRARTALEATIAFGLFLKDLLSIYHRGHTIELARHFLSALRGKSQDQECGTSCGILFLEFELLSQLCDYDHFLEINAPSNFPEDASTLFDKLCEDHLLMGMVLRECFLCMTCAIADARRRALGILLQLLLKLDGNEKYQTDEARAKISMLFFPVVLKVIDDPQLTGSHFFELHEEQALFSIFLYVLKYATQKMLHAWLRSEIPSRVSLLVNALATAVQCFEVKSDKVLSFAAVNKFSRDRLYEEFIGYDPAVTPRSPAGPEFYGTSPRPKRITSKGTLSRGSIRSGMGTTRRMPNFSDASPAQSMIATQSQIAMPKWQAKSLSVEASFIVLDAVEKITEFFVQPLKEGSDLFKDIFDVLMIFFRTGQPPRFFPHLFATTRSFIAKFSNQLFNPESTYCGTLCEELVRFCNSPVDTIRTQATATLYVLSKWNYRECKNVDIVQSYITASLSRLSLPDTRMFERSLATAAMYSQKDTLAAGVIMVKRKKHHSNKVEKRTNALQRDIEALGAWIQEAVRESTAPFQVGSEEEVKDLIKKHTILSQESSKREVQFMAITERVRELPECNASNLSSKLADLKNTWELAAIVISERHHILKAEATKQHLHNKMLKDFYDLVANMSHRLDALKAAPPVDLKSAQAEMSALMRHIYGAATSMALLDPSRPDEESVIKELESKFEQILLICPLKENQADVPADAAKSSEFSRCVVDLSAYLTTVIRDTHKLTTMKTAGTDPQIIQELELRIAKGYAKSPDLSLTWLNILSRVHLEPGEENVVEAGICKVFAMLVIHENISSMLPIALNVAVLEEIDSSLTQLDLVGRFVSPEISEHGLISTAMGAIELFKRSDYYEFCKTVYDFILPLLHYRNNVSMLADAYMGVHDLYAALAKKDSARLFGNYLRIGFYGKSFGEQSGCEYIYMEKPGAHLFSVRDKLLAKYDGGSGVTVLDSTASVEALDPEKQFIQLTSVKPFFTEEENKARNTYFKKTVVVKRFFYETPFVKDGKPYSEDVRRHWKRKVILTTESSLPSALKRQKVVSRETIESSPIENAIETLCKRQTEMMLEIEKIKLIKGGEAPHLDSLQRLLQGSVLPQVNGGILELLTAFLSPEGKELFPDFNEKLIDAISSFLDSCREGLDLHTGLIAQDRREFHMSLEGGFSELVKRVKALRSDSSN